MRRFAFCALIGLVCASIVPNEVFVDPIEGNDTLEGGTRESPLRSLRAAREAVRSLLRENLLTDIIVQLLPGTHHVGDEPLILGSTDGGGKGWVTWRSADQTNPATIGAPIRVTGWKPHPTNKKAMSAPLPANVSRGTALRQFWVKGKRAERPRIYGHGRQPGDNMNGYCLNLTNASSTAMFPEGSAFDFTAESATDPSTWPNPSGNKIIK
jgi:hypothetical protein